MSIWSHCKTFLCWEEAYEPEERSAEVWIHTATSWNDCIRLDVADCGEAFKTVIATAMLDRDMARELGEYLIRYAESGPEQLMADSLAEPRRGIDPLLDAGKPYTSDRSRWPKIVRDAAQK